MNAKTVQHPMVNQEIQIKYPRHPNEEAKRGRVSQETLKQRKEYWHSINGDDVFPTEQDVAPVVIETKKEHNKHLEEEAEVPVYASVSILKVARKQPMDFYETFGFLKKHGETFSFVEWKDGTAYWYPTAGLKILNWK